MSFNSISFGSYVNLPDDPGFATFMWGLYRNNEFTDTYFELKTKDKEIVFNAHRLILSLWSPVFEDMLYQSEKQNNKISLNDVNPEAFNDMLNYMYGVDPVLESCEKAFELHKVAAKFEVVSLISLCQEFIREVEVEVTNVFHIFEVAESMQSRILMDKCMKIIQDKTRCIFTCYDCCDISPSMIRILLKCPMLSLVCEYELLIWIFAWAKNMYHDKSMYGNVRAVLKEFLPELHFLALTNIQFATICKSHKEFFDEKEAQSIFMNIAIHGSWPLPDWCDADAKFRIYTGKDNENISISA